MTPTTPPPPALLPPEMLADIREEHDCGLIHGCPAEEHRRQLLAHLAAREAQVAAELARLLAKDRDDHESAFDEGFYAAVFDRNRAIHRLAARLGLTLGETGDTASPL